MFCKIYLYLTRQDPPRSTHLTQVSGGHVCLIFQCVGVCDSFPVSLVCGAAQIHRPNVERSLSADDGREVGMAFFFYLFGSSGIERFKDPQLVGST